MDFFSRLSNGWQIARTSLKVLNAHKELIMFPILSGMSMAAVIASFTLVYAGRFGWHFDALFELNRAQQYLVVFVFYIVNYFIVVFFNMGLMHCARLYFDGEEVSISKGLQFSASRLGAIFAWALFAATIGTLLKIIQDNSGWLGKIVAGIVGFVWSIATFFVVPVIAYEKVGPFEALERSSKMMKEKWGESLGANFSMSLVGFIGMILVAVPAMAISALLDETTGILIMVGGMLLVWAVVSALNSIFISAVYNNMRGNLNAHFDQRMLDDLFVQRD